jgi:hypothetical protein
MVCRFAMPARPDRAGAAAARARSALAAGLCLWAALAAGLGGCGGDSSVQKGPLGADCVGTGNPACLSGRCLVLDTSTAYCTQPCQAATDCPQGFLCLAGAGGGTVCQSRGAGGVCGSGDDCPAGLQCDTSAARCYIPVTRSACGVCTSDKQCGSGGTCHSEGTGESFCAPSCGAGDACPIGYLCAAAADAGGQQRCLPQQPASSPPAVGSCRGGRPLCAPCKGDLECGRPGDVCARNLISGESFCGRSCKTSGDCPSHFSCTDLSGNGSGPTQCVPDSGTCAGYCDAADAATVVRECGLGSSCDLLNHACHRLTDGSPCAACATDDDCTAHAASSRCVQNRTAGSPFLGERFCGSDCSSGTCPGAGCSANAAACPGGFSCVGLGSGGGWPFQCAPARGTCVGGQQRLGDPCDRTGSGDCQSGICAQFGSERRCSLDCTSDAQCGDPRWRCCSSVGRGTPGESYDCAVPAAGAPGICAPVGGSFGEDCAAGSPPCAEGLCLDLGTAQLCTRGCDAGHACPTGFSCQQGTLKGQGGSVSICFPDGGGTVGAACAFGPAACQSHLCLKKDSGNVCTLSCTADKDCPATWTCGAIAQVGGGKVSACLPPGVLP